jgi:putative transposase
MRKGIFSEKQMVGILRVADRQPVAQVAKKHGISEQTIYTWRLSFSGRPHRPDRHQPGGHPQ